MVGTAFLFPRGQSFVQSDGAAKENCHVEVSRSGVDFLGWVHFPKYRVLRTATVRRMKKRLIIHPTLETIQSYHGLLGHGNATQLQAMLLDEYERIGQDVY